MEELSNPFRKVGIVLLVIGILDIGVMAYCIANKISYSSSFNIFAVIAGILLIKGSVKTARVIRWFSAFFVIAFIALMFIMPITTPVKLLVTQFKVNTGGMLATYAISLLFIGILLWVYLQLSKPSALARLKDAGYKTGKPITALYAVLIMVALGGVLFFSIFNSESAERAKALAKEQMGSNYQYHISSLNISGNSGSAVVIAYNSSEIKYVKVEW